MDKDKPTRLYQLYNAADELIYVGITVGLGGRLQDHEKKPWWGK